MSEGRSIGSVARSAQSRLLLLGHFALRRDGESSDTVNLSSKKARALIAFLAMQPDYAADREQLAALLWGERSDRNARQALRQCLSVLRGELAIAGLELLVTQADEVALRRETLAIDAREFLALAECSTATEVAQAVELYRGEFLVGLDFESETFGRWVHEQRARTEAAAARVFETHARLMDAAGKGHHAIAAVDRLIAIDPLREDWQRLNLEIYARHQGRDAAMARAKSFTALLHAELGVAPEPATRALLVELRRGNGVASDASVQRATEAFIPVPADGGHCAMSASVAAGLALSDGSGEDGQKAPPPIRSKEPGAVWPSLGAPVKYALALGFFAAIALDTLLDAGIGPWYEKVFAVPFAAGPHTAEVSSQARVATAASHTALPLLVIAVREEGAADRSLIDAFTDEISDHLSGLPGIKVISRRSANLFITKAGDVTKLGPAFGVHYVVEASLQRDGSETWLDVALIDAGSGHELWSERTETPTAELGRLQEQISAQFTAKIQQQLDYASDGAGIR
jgi:DNA-binding SARP family transcriptional activator/TolB-like protein